jgi:hypothetical protein
MFANVISIFFESWFEGSDGWEQTEHYQLSEP